MLFWWSFLCRWVCIFPLQLWTLFSFTCVFVVLTVKWPEFSGHVCFGFSMPVLFDCSSLYLDWDNFCFSEYSMLLAFISNLFYPGESGFFLRFLSRCHSWSFPLLFVFDCSALSTWPWLSFFCLGEFTGKDFYCMFFFYLIPWILHFHLFRGFFFSPKSSESHVALFFHLNISLDNISIVEVLIFLSSILASSIPSTIQEKNRNKICCNSSNMS